MFSSLVKLGLLVVLTSPVWSVGYANYKMKQCWEKHGPVFACRAGLNGYHSIKAREAAMNGKRYEVR